MEEPHTHPIPPTLRREDASDWTRELWEKLRDVIANEEAWYILEEARHAAREDFGARSSRKEFVEEPLCILREEKL
jgi:hypothetical protein